MYKLSCSQGRSQRNIWGGQITIGQKLQKNHLAKALGSRCLPVRTGAEGSQGGLPPQSTCLAHPNNELTLSKTAAFGLNFKLCSLSPDKCVAPLSQLLCFPYFDFCLKLLVFILFTNEYGLNYLLSI